MEQELLKNNFERHGFKTSFFDTKEAALALEKGGARDACGSEKCRGVHNQRQWCFQNRRTGQYRWNRKPRVADLIRTGKSIFCHWKQ